MVDSVDRLVSEAEQRGIGQWVDQSIVMDDVEPGQAEAAVNAGREAGDCLRACVASVVGVPLDSVPPLRAVPPARRESPVVVGARRMAPRDRMGDHPARCARRGGLVVGERPESTRA